jgi:hypothetical protein
MVYSSVSFSVSIPREDTKAFSFPLGFFIELLCRDLSILLRDGMLQSREKEGKTTFMLKKNVRPDRISKTLQYFSGAFSTDTLERTFHKSSIALHERGAGALNRLHMKSCEYVKMLVRRAHHLDRLGLIRIDATGVTFSKVLAA